MTPPALTAPVLFCHQLPVISLVHTPNLLNPMKFENPKTLNEVCSISFNEDNIKDYMDTIYEKRYISFVGICPKTAPSKGYTICKYTNWVGMHGKIGDKNNYHMYLSKDQFYNLSRFRLGA